MKLIKVEHASKEIKGNMVLDDVNVELHSGNIYGFTGVNGSGKTMLMRAVTGLVHLKSGEIITDGKVLGKDIEFPESAGVLIENPGLDESKSGFVNLKQVAQIRKITSDKFIEELMLKLLLDPNDRRKVKKYSLGMKQKIGIAEAFIDEPELLVLDEPFNALDKESAEIVKNMIKTYVNDERIIILACHDGNIIDELCDEIFYMENGRLYENEEEHD